ncbi:MAG: hypothetical protein AB8G05_20905 [Oligoflexales bacterium]
MAEIIMAIHLFYIISHSNVDIPLWHENVEDSSNIASISVEAQTGNPQFISFDHNSNLLGQKPWWLSKKIIKLDEEELDSQPIR